MTWVLPIAVAGLITVAVPARSEEIVLHACDDLSAARVIDGAGSDATALELSVAPGDGSCLHLKSVSPADGKIVYISADLRIAPTDLTHKGLLVDVWTSVPNVARAFYVRGYDAQKRCVLSWMSWAGLLDAEPTTFVLLPGRSTSGMKWEPYKATSDDVTAVTTLRFYVGAKAVSSPFDLFINNVRTQDIEAARQALLAKGEPTGVIDRARFTDHGVGAAIAELRGVVVRRTEDGRNLVIATVIDQGPRGYVLVTDIDSGETRQVFCPQGVAHVDPFGALLASSGKFYHTQGKVLLELDPATCEWTFQGIPSDSVSVYLCFTEGPDGTVWAGGVYQTQLISFNPATREMRDHGRMDPEESYLQFLATDTDGWVYAGIGTARCNLVAYNPATGEKRMLIDEAQRVHGSGSVYPGADGAAYGTAAGRTYRLRAGTATEIDRADAAPRRQVHDLKYGGRIMGLPDGRRVLGVDLESRTIRVRNADSDQVRTLSFDYATEGAAITSLAEGPDARVYASTCHPMHFVMLETASGRVTDMGPIPQVGGGNFCAIARRGNLMIGAQYAAGQLWAYDVTKPWNTGTRRVQLAVTATQLAKIGRVDNGHLSYLSGHDICFVHGDAWGAAAQFTLSVPEAGAYRLYVAPYLHNNYCTVQLVLDGKPLGRPFHANSKTTEPGAVQSFGPMDLAAGDHTFAVRTIETEGAQPFFGLCGLELTQNALALDEIVREPNPRVLARWHRDICRPRTALAHADGKHVMMAGFAGYGLCGGGIGIYNLETGSEQLLTADRDLLPGHSCITLKCLPNGDLVGGTSISAPGGGHPTATEAELFIVDWRTKELTFHTAPVPGDANIVSIQVHESGKVYGLSSNSTLFVFDPASRTVVHSHSLAACGSVPRHALQWGAQGELYAIMSDTIVRIAPDTFAHRVLTSMPVKVTAGGACVGDRLCFAAGSHLWTYTIPDGQ